MSSDAETSERVIEIRPDEDKLLQLYEAALRGSVSTLSMLIQNDPLILHRVSLSSKPETPLHISAWVGHLDFTKALLTTKPKLTSQLDSSKCSPLHLASAEGHTEIVKALLGVNTNVCLVPDAEGRIPLHLAAMRGNVEIIQELFDAEPNSIHQKVNGNSALHLCIQYNQLEALRRLVTLVNENQLLDFKDDRGNTILHLAVVLKQSETVRYLVSIPKLKGEVNALNKFGNSALDMLEPYSARDFKYLEIRDILIRAGAVGENNILTFSNQQESLLPIAAVGENNTDTNSETGKCSGTANLWCNFVKCFKHDVNWVEKRQKTLMLVATLAATMSFQVATNPPGGIWQQDYNKTNVDACENYKYNFTMCQAGYAVMAYVSPSDYSALIAFATISFTASLTVVLLAISGVPLKNKFCTRFLTIAMVFGIIFTMLTYFMAQQLVTPKHLLEDITGDMGLLAFVCLCLVGLSVVCAIIRLSISFFAFGRKMLRRLLTAANNPINS